MTRLPAAAQGSVSFPVSTVSVWTKVPEGNVAAAQRVS